MKPIQFPESNIVLNKPAEMTDDECMPLPVCVCRDADDIPLMISCWEPTDEEWDALRKQRCIYIAVVSETKHPPLIVFPGNPFNADSEPTPVDVVAYQPINPDPNCNDCGGTGVIVHELTREPVPCMCTAINPINSDKPTHE